MQKLRTIKDGLKAALRFAVNSTGEGKENVLSNFFSSSLLLFFCAPFRETSVCECISVLERAR